MINHPFWELYYHSAEPNSISGDFTHYNTISIIQIDNIYRYYKPIASSTCPKKDADKTPENCKNLKGILKMMGDRPLLRYYYNDLSLEKVKSVSGNGMQSNKVLKQINKNETESIVEPELDYSLLDKGIKYMTKSVKNKPKDKVSAEKFSFNMKFIQKEIYTKKYNKHFPIVMADSVYIPEIKTRFELNRDTNWYEPTLQYEFIHDP